MEKAALAGRKVPPTGRMCQSNTFFEGPLGCAGTEIHNAGRREITFPIPEGRDVGDLLMHHDDSSKLAVPDANGVFLYVTREGTIGLIETTDRVTQTANLTGMMRPPPAGFGFQKGVRFNYEWIVP